MPEAEEHLFEITDLPQHCPGAPLPMIVSDDHVLQVFYYLPSRIGNAMAPESVTFSQASAPVAVVMFHGTWASYFGSPNDEALNGYPLYEKGLGPYATFEVLQSRWIASMARQNAVHPRHTDALFAGLRHFIMTFHDSTLEIVARSYDSKIVTGPMAVAVRESFIFS